MSGQHQTHCGAPLCCDGQAHPQCQHYYEDKHPANNTGTLKAPPNPGTNTTP